MVLEIELTGYTLFYSRVIFCRIEIFLESDGICNCSCQQAAYHIRTIVIFQRNVLNGYIFTNYVIVLVIDSVCNIYILLSGIGIYIAHCNTFVGLISSHKVFTGHIKSICWTRFIRQRRRLILILTPWSKWFCGAKEIPLFLSFYLLSCLQGSFMSID